LILPLIQSALRFDAVVFRVYTVVKGKLLLDVLKGTQRYGGTIDYSIAITFIISKLWGLNGILVMKNL
jgi:hypothetical protein